MPKSESCRTTWGGPSKGGSRPTRGRDRNDLLGRTCGRGSTKVGRVPGGRGNRSRILFYGQPGGPEKLHCPAKTFEVRIQPGFKLPKWGVGGLVWGGLRKPNERLDSSVEEIKALEVSSTDCWVLKSLPARGNHRGELGEGHRGFFAKNLVPGEGRDNSEICLPSRKNVDRSHAESGQKGRQRRRRGNLSAIE